MAPRPTLQTLLESFGAAEVYFQPPPTVKMKYPCIRYSLSDIEMLHADNQPYKWDDAYEVMVITRNPDDGIRDHIKRLPMCRFDRSYTADNLYHFVFRLFF